MQIELVTKKNENLYSSFVSSHPKALFYYELRYRNLIKNFLNCGDEYYVLIDDNKVKAILPLLYKDGKFGRVYNSLAYCGSNGSILAVNEIYYNETLKKYNEIIKRSAASTYIENPLDIHVIKPDYDYISERVCQFSTFDKNLDMEDLSKLYTQQKRREIKKAIKIGVNVTVDTSDESKDFLFNIHFENMRAIQSGLHKDKKIFDLFYKKYQAGKDYNIFIAKKNDIKLAALLVFYFNKITEYYTPVIVKQYRSYQPLTALIHEAIKYSVSKNFLYWNWGGNGIGLNNVYEFKKKWGAKDYFYNYYTKINNENFLNLSSEVILNEYRGFYTVPFDNLNN